MRQLAAALALAALAPLLGGCPPPVYGITRAFTAAAIPDPDCVQRQIRSLPGITDMRYDAGTPNAYYSYATEAPGSSGPWSGVSLSVSRLENGGAAIQQQQISSRRDAARRDALAVRALMLQLEARLAEQCGLHPTGAIDENMQ